MSTSMSGRSTRDRLHSVLVVAMAVGLAVFIAAIYFMITGEYASLPARRAHEATLNNIAIGGLLFSAAAWYVDQFLRPLLRVSHRHS